MLAANAGTAKERDIISAKDKQRKIFANYFMTGFAPFDFCLLNHSLRVGTLLTAWASPPYNQTFSTSIGFSDCL